MTNTPFPQQQQDMNMDSDATTSTDIPLQPPQPQTMDSVQSLMNQITISAPPQTELPPSTQTRDNFRDIPVKVHMRKPDKDNWTYLGRGIVSHEMIARSSRIVVRSAQSHKIITAFGEGAPLQAEKRGNFVVISCVEGTRVVSWSLNTLNTSETLRLLAIIELSCYSCKQSIIDPHMQGSYRRRVTRAIKEDRRKRHKRRKDQESMVAAFAKTDLADSA